MIFREYLYFTDPRFFFCIISIGSGLKFSLRPLVIGIDINTNYQPNSLEQNPQFYIFQKIYARFASFCILAQICKSYLCESQVGFGYDNSVSSQTDDVGHVAAAILAHVACVVGFQTNDVRRN